MKTLPLLAALLLAGSCSRKNTQTGTASLNPASANYTPRIGVAVVTGARTCIAIANANLAPGTPITLVAPLPPQSVTQVSVAGPSNSVCPTGKDLDPALTSYNLQVPPDSNLPKLTPLTAVTGTSAPFTTGANNNVQADLDQNGKFETFRACSGNDGIHLTVWSGAALNGTVLWHGYYYEPSNPGIGPACTPTETAP